MLDVASNFNQMEKMAVYDPHFGGYRIFVGDLGRQATRYDIEREYERYGQLVDVWVARNPPGFAFIVFKNADECERAVRKSHGRRLCGRRVRVEYARPFDDRSGKQKPPVSHSKHRSRSPKRYRTRSRSPSPRGRTRASSGTPSPRRRSRSKERRPYKSRRNRSRSESENTRPSRYSRERNRSVSRSRDRSTSPSPNRRHSSSSSPISKSHKGDIPCSIHGETLTVKDAV